MRVAEWISKIRKRGRYEHYLFFQFLLWVSLPLLIMTAVTCYIYLQSENEKSRFMLEAYAGQIEDICGGYFTEIKEYYLDIVNNSIYQELLERESLPWDSLEEIAELQSQLNGERIESYVNSYCFINVQHGWVLCNYGMYSMERLKNSGEVIQLVEEIRERPGDILWVDRGTQGSPWQNGVIGYGLVDLSGELMVLKSENFLGELEGILIVQMRMEVIENNISAYSELGYDTVILSQEEILAGGESGYADSISEEDLQSGDDAFLETGRYKTEIVHDEVNGLKYVTVYDTHVNMQKAMTLVWSAVLFILAYAFLLFVLKKVTNNVLKPFWKLKANNDEQQEKIKEFFVTNLIKGSWDENRIGQYMEKYGWKTWKGYRLMLLKPEGEQMEIDAMLSGLSGEIKERCFILPVYFRDYIAVIVGADDEMRLEYEMAVLFRDMSEFAEKRYHTNMIAGVSGYFTSLENCSLAVSQCREAMRARAVEGQKSVLSVYDDLSLKERKKEMAFPGTEGEIYDGVRENDKKKTANALHEAFLFMKDSELWGIERTIYVYQLVMKILSIPQKEGIPLTEIFPDAQMDILDMREFLYDNGKLEQYIAGRIVNPIMETMAKNQVSRDMEIVRKAAGLVKEKQGDITLTECAEYLKCHPSHLSRVLKKEKGISFQDMINSEKIEKAKRFLKETNISVAEISDLVGYSNTQNFIRFFKSQTGITPAKYRKEIREE